MSGVERLAIGIAADDMRRPTRAPVAGRALHHLLVVLAAQATQVRQRVRATGTAPKDMVDPDRPSTAAGDGALVLVALQGGSPQPAPCRRSVEGISRHQVLPKGAVTSITR